MEQPREAHDLDTLVAQTAGLQPGRRIFHAVNGLVVFAFLRFVPLGRGVVIAVFGGLLLAALAFDVARLRVRTLNVLFFRAFARLASPREAAKVASSTWYLAGVVLVLWLFPLAWAEVAVLVLALADPLAGYAGRRWGGTSRLGTGTWLGSSIFLAVSTALLSTVAHPLAAFAAALVVTAIEALPWPLDDNITIPIATCVALLLVQA